MLTPPIMLLNLPFLFFSSFRFGFRPTQYTIEPSFAMMVLLLMYNTFAHLTRRLGIKCIWNA
jgi:uncharacterized membrane-anchored protein YitT (DUF2179 family)